MSITKRIASILLVLMVLSLLSSACTTPTPQIIIQTKPVDIVLEKDEQLVEKEVIVGKEEHLGAFKTLNPKLADLKVRQAMAYCTNKLELVQASYPLISRQEQQSLVMDTFIPKNHWAYAGDENVTIYPFDPEKGKALLEEAGWAEAGGYRYNVTGEELAFKLTTTNASFRQTWAAVWEQQMRNCGITIIRLHEPASWWLGDTTGLAHREFELGAYSWVGQADPGGRTMWACDQIPFPENEWQGQNTMGWCNEKADTGIKNATNSLIKDERVRWYREVQQAYTEDVPAIPLFNRYQVFATRTELQGFAPTPGEEMYMHNISEWTIPGKDTIVLGFSQEPPTLYTAVERIWTASSVMMLVNPRPFTSLNYDFHPVLLTQIPTIENGFAANNDVAVKEGDWVMDINGELTTLSPGITVKNAAGEAVDFKGGTVLMKQLVVKYEYRPDLVYSDGVHVSQADFELGYKVLCDRESGMTSYVTCEKTQSIDFFANGYTITWVPGNQDPIYFYPPFTYFPSHRIIESEGFYKGKTLSEIPPKDWPTLPEVYEHPIGVGPYMIDEWIKNEKITFLPNPYWYGGTPATPRIVIAFVNAENAEAKLRRGQIDVLGPESLAGITETLQHAELTGIIITYVIPGGTWEHIDFNLYLK